MSDNLTFFIKNMITSILCIDGWCRVGGLEIEGNKENIFIAC